MQGLEPSENMASSIKDSAEPLSLSKTGSGNPQKAGQAPRSNPVCLDVAVTLRSLQREDSTSTKQFREECRTVIVFDNGAVLRCNTNPPAGQSVILTNQHGNEAICRVAVGRSLPSVKGYVEVEFVEPVNDFWQIRKDARPASVPTPSVSPTPAPQPLAESLGPPPGAVRPPAKPPAPEPAATPPTGRAPSFEDIAGVVRTSPPAASRKNTGTEKSARMDETQGKPAVESTRPSKAAASSILRHSNAPELITDVSSNPGASGSTFPVRRTAAPSSDFLSNSLLSSAPVKASPGSGNAWVARALVVIALVLAGYAAWTYLIQPNMSTFVNGKKADTASTPALPPLPERTASAPDEAPKATPARAEVQPEVTRPSSTPESLVPEESPAVTESPNEPRQGRQAKATKPAKEANFSAAPQAAIPNLALKSPKAPKQNPVARAQQTSPLTDIVAPDPTADAPTAGALPAVARTANQPTPPAPAFAPSNSTPAPSAPAASTPAASVSAVKATQDARLISSTRPVYPEAAKASNVQGIVVVAAQVDSRGNVVDAKVLSGPIPLRQAALDSVKKWKYSPAIIDGAPASSQVTVNVDFRLK